MATRVRSHAKINLGLYIGPSRPDGFHALSTVYQTLEVHDFVTVTAQISGKTSIILTTNDPRVPTDNRNTAWKAAEALLARLGVAATISIHIEKRLPVQGGLGAGSANAVAALVGLGRELEKAGIQRLPGDARLELAAEIGSDVPLFLIGGSILGLNRGEEVYPLPDSPPLWCTVATPSVGVSTPQAFQDWDALCAAGKIVGLSQAGLTQTPDGDRLKWLSRLFASAFTGAGEEIGSSGVSAAGGDQALLLALVRTGIENDFERVVFAQHPSLYEIKQTLAGTPETAVYAALSGSGSALFGLYLDQQAAEAALARLQAKSVAGFVTRTLARSEYWQRMFD
jgi:4-diphosphocytidyl-2-C-methyl-D-erythritol kinase